MPRHCNKATMGAGTPSLITHNDRHQAKNENGSKPPRYRLDPYLIPPRIKMSSFGYTTVFTAVEHVSQLPDSILQSVCRFLPPTSHLLFAVAVSGSTLSSRKPPPIGWQPSTASKAIVLSVERDTVDFGDNDEALVGRLTDDDLAGMLLCMDAASNLKRLRLTNCTNICGRGLAPLIESLVIEQFDFSIADATDWEQSGMRRGRLAMDIVIPILYTIINCEGNSLKQLQLPKLWREQRKGRLTDFLERYNEVLNSRHICSSDPSCCKAARARPFVWAPIRGSKYGLQGLICYECNEHICVPPDEHNDYKNFCVGCEHTICNECMPTRVCEECKEPTCFKCTLIGECQDCNRVTCVKCMPVLQCPCCRQIRCDDCGPMTYCSLCNSHANCEGCLAENVLVELCDFCEEIFCSGCRKCSFCNDCGEMYCEACRDTLHKDECSAKKPRRNK